MGDKMNREENMVAFICCSCCNAHIEYDYRIVCGKIVCPNCYNGDNSEVKK